MTRQFFARRLGCMATIVAITVLALPAGLASAAPAHTCQDGEVITHGGFSTLNYAGTLCTVTTVKIGVVTDTPLPTSNDQPALFTANASTINQLDINSYTTGDEAVINSSKITTVNAYTAKSVSFNRSQVGQFGPFGSISYLSASSSSFTAVGDLEIAAALVLNGVRLRSTTTFADYYLNAGDGTPVTDYRPTVSISNTHVDGSLTLTNPLGVQVCDLHTTKNLTVLGDHRQPDGPPTGSTTVLGGSADSCGPHSGIRVDGNLTLNRGTTANPVQLRHVIIGGVLTCLGSAHVIFDDVTVRGHAVTQC